MSESITNSMGNSGPDSGPIQHKELPLLAKPLSRKLPNTLNLSKKVNPKPLRAIVDKNPQKEEMKRDRRAGI